MYEAVSPVCDCGTPWNFLLPFYLNAKMLIKYEPAHEKKVTHGFPVCGSSNAHAQSPIWATKYRYAFHFVNKKTAILMRVVLHLALSIPLKPSPVPWEGCFSACDLPY